MSTNPDPAAYPELIPRVFIGSSSKALELARRIRDELKRGQELEVEVWDNKVLQSGDMLLEGLLRLVNLFDFAILVLSPDDIVESGEKRARTPRDNVVFELGMFMSVFGRRRALPIVLLDRANPLKLPVDLAGLLYTELDIGEIDNSTYFTEKVANVREQIKQRSKTAPLSLLPSTALALGYFNNFLIPVKEGLAEYSKNKRPIFNFFSELTSTKGYSKKEIEEGNFVFWILYPQLASKASVTHRGECVKKLALEPVGIKHKGRSYPFFVYRERDQEGRVQFADYPTTLRSSSDAINLVLAKQEIGQFREEKEQLERKEVANFIKALGHLIVDRAVDIGGDFPERVKFKQV